MPFNYLRHRHNVSMKTPIQVFLLYQFVRSIYHLPRKKVFLNYQKLVAGFLITNTEIPSGKPLKMYMQDSPLKIMS